MKYILLSLFLVLPLILNAQTKKAVTVHGDLVDVVAFVSSGAKQEAEAITKSAKAGNPLGLYDSKAKKLYLVGSTQVNQSANEALVPYIGMRVFVTGKVYTRNGTNVILMSDIGKSIK
jgi:hypothetical protein